MKNFKFILIPYILVTLFFGTSHAGDNVVLRYEYFLYINNINNFTDEVRTFASKNRGYVKYFSRRKIVIRVPKDAALDLRSIFKKKYYINDVRIYRSDKSELLVQLRTRLKVKEKLLSDLYKLFETSKFHQTLDVEGEIGKVIIEIERLKGKISYYKDKAELSEVRININKRGLSKKTDRVYTRFKWIRGLGIPNIIGQFAN
ncbi:DUF4349 domain-containing protein [Spirochaetota bacterium]